MGILKFECIRAFQSKGFFLALGISILFVLAHMFIDIPRNLMLQALPIKSVFHYPLSLYNRWIGLDFTSFVTVSFYLCLPIIAALPHMSSYYTDGKKGYARHILLRTTRLRYLLAKYIAVFCTALVVTVVPLLLDLLLTACFFPALVPTPLAGQFSVGNSGLWAPLFYTNPLLYTLLYLLLDAVFLGVFVCSAMALAEFMSFSLEMLLLPFLVHAALYFLCQWYSLEPFAPANWLVPLQPANGIHLGIILGETLVLLLITLLFYFIRGTRSKGIL